MKILIVFILSLFCFQLIAQVEKDLLLKQDSVKLVSELRFMHFVSKARIDAYLYSRSYETKASKSFKDFFYESIALGNKELHDSIASYIGVKNIKTPGRFIKAVSDKNFERFRQMIEKYGYLSPNRLKVDFGDKKYVVSAGFLLLKDKIDEKLLDLIENECSIGNMGDYDYLIFQYSPKK